MKRDKRMVGESGGWRGLYGQRFWPATRCRCTARAVTSPHSSEQREGKPPSFALLRMTPSRDPITRSPMIRSRLLLSLPAAVLLAAPPSAQYKPKYTVEQFLSPPFPLVFASAQKADRIAWVGYDRGKRNVYTAAAPNFTPVKLTTFDKDDGQDITAVDVSDEGSTTVFVRGSQPK